MLIHQVHNSLNSEIFNACLYHNWDCPVHLHRGYEWICVLNGNLSVTVDQTVFPVGEGHSILIFPYQLHGFVCQEDTDFYIVVFSGNEVDSFSKDMKKQTTETPTFVPSAATFSYARESFLGNCIPTGKQSTHLAPPAFLRRKAALYAITSDFSEQCELSEISSKGRAWMMEILHYVEEHFTEDISLGGIAEQMGYSYEHLSRAMKDTLGIGFKELLNQYRCERARHLIERGNDSLTNIAYKSGFQSVRTFNRVFKEKLGLLPSEYQKAQKGEIRHIHSGNHHLWKS
ncbi:MAG: helix-turn-helix transcriptional regulator [Clostridia bacterium]|nr:helix-turn-helix transcriptional regulator [Clostridia bacterium]